MRSIPARAGQPTRYTLTEKANAVYPRPRGATDPLHADREGERGLSPPARGNPAAQGVGFGAAGSIPARAGQPSDSSVLPYVHEVYPRPRGAT